VKLSWMHSLPLRSQSLNGSVDTFEESTITTSRKSVFVH
jgi:hypothetical protein